MGTLIPFFSKTSCMSFSFYYHRIIVS